MSNRPIPRKGLLGCWFLDDRGIAYNAGTNEAKDRSGRGNHATYKNGVTVGVEGDPAREFGASGFDASSNQFASFNDSLSVNGAQAVVAIFRAREGANTIISSNTAQNGYAFNIINSELTISILDGNGDGVGASTPINLNRWYTAVGAFTGEQVVLYVGSTLKDTTQLSTHNPSSSDTEIGRNSRFDDFYWDGEIAAVGRYDLTVSNAPEPSEIARKWDKLRDIPATR